MPQPLDGDVTIRPVKLEGALHWVVEERRTRTSLSPVPFARFGLARQFAMDYARGLGVAVWFSATPLASERDTLLLHGRSGAARSA
ncbi:MAG: hypothetical protein AB7O67_08955 [Vicinamibacterales bacterium]